MHVCILPSHQESFIWRKLEPTQFPIYPLSLCCHLLLNRSINLWSLLIWCNVPEACLFVDTKNVKPFLPKRKLSLFYSGLEKNLSNLKSVPNFYESCIALHTKVLQRSNFYKITPHCWKLFLLSQLISCRQVKLASYSSSVVSHHQLFPSFLYNTLFVKPRLWLVIMQKSTGTKKKQMKAMSLDESNKRQGKVFLILILTSCGKTFSLKFAQLFFTSYCPGNKKRNSYRNLNLESVHTSEEIRELIINSKVFTIHI